MYNRHILIIHKIFNKHIRESAVRLNKFQKILKNKKELGVRNAGSRVSGLKSTDRLLNKINNLKIGNRGEDTPEIELGGVLNAALGLSGEVGELNDMLKKWIFHEKQLDSEHLKREISDVCWYLALMCDSFEFSLDEIMQINIDKLKARYPEGFDTYRANHRQAGDV